MIDVAVLREGRAGRDQEFVASLAQQIGCTHFRELLPLATDDARAFYVKEIIDRNLGVHDLCRAIVRASRDRGLSDSRGL